MVILHYLLLKPMLAHLDKRKARIDNAKNKQLNDNKLIADLTENAQKSAKLAQEQAFIDAQNRVSEKQAQAESDLADASRNEHNKTTEFKLALENEKVQLEDTLNNNASRLAQLFISEFVS
ncbi:MAG: hypothetical protein IKM01_01075 [Clostridia bacterium]|nr:hypothetical protein [Clostridia bacterium]